jgi:hypothetical protein
MILFTLFGCFLSTVDQEVAQCIEDYPAGEYPWIGGLSPAQQDERLSAIEAQCEEVGEACPREEIMSEAAAGCAAEARGQNNGIHAQLDYDEYFASPVYESYDGTSQGDRVELFLDAITGDELLGREAEPAETGCRTVDASVKCG